MTLPGESLLVAAGGAAGAVLRFLLNSWAVRAVPTYPAGGTLLVNVLGCFAIGVAVVLLEDRDRRDPWRAAGVIGLLGSLTTFSTFGYQTVELANEGFTRAAVLNVAANLLVGFAAVVAGLWVGRLLKPVA